MTYRSPLEMAIWRSLARALWWGFVCAGVMYGVVILLALFFLGAFSRPWIVDALIDPLHAVGSSVRTRLGFLNGQTAVLSLWFLVGAAAGFVHSMLSWWRRGRSKTPSS